MGKLINKLFFNKNKIQTFYISRLHANEVAEKVYLKNGAHRADITSTNSMICLDPFCMAAWLPAEQAALTGNQEAEIHFVKGSQLNAVINVSLIEKIPTPKGILFLYKVKKVKNHQLSALHRLVLFAYFLRSKANTYHSRKVISAMYSYPRSIIIVSYKDADYCNIFPMDIHGYIQEEEMYLLGLRTTNVTLDKILAAKKVVVCDTNDVDINTVYDLGKHSSKSPAAPDHLPFKTTESELFRFPVPDFIGSYKEIEIITNKKMGYHMLMIGKVLNKKQVKDDPSSLYHIGFLQFQKGNYKSIDGLF
ncbi:MAG: oxidoreductase RutF, flavin reductase family [Mucilaginibacter sp.]|nr:oxidoreductase RutF, flavin reductase family [Mucilaginibacter sp.]